jgi:hypothetical protein
VQMSKRDRQLLGNAIGAIRMDGTIIPAIDGADLGVERLTAAASLASIEITVPVFPDESSQRDDSDASPALVQSCHFAETATVSLRITESTPDVSNPPLWAVSASCCTLISLSRKRHVVSEGGRNDVVFKTRSLAPRRPVDVMHDSKTDFVVDEPTDLCSPFIDDLGVTGVAIAVFGPRGGQSTICSSDAVAARIDELQFDLGEGPQWTTLKTGVPTLVPDVSTGNHDSWPIFAASISSLHVGALFSFPMLMGAVTVGTVGLYRRTAGALSPQRVEIAVTLASALTGVAVRHVIAGADNEDAGESMVTPAMRREVHQATGMILVQLDTTATNAYSRLQAHAFANGRTVQDIARDVVSRRLSFRSLPE